MSDDFSFYRQLLLLGAVLALIALSLQIFTDIITIYHWLGLLYFFSLTAFSYMLIAKGIKSQDVDFISYFMGASAIRLLLSAIILFLYFYFVKEGAVSFTAGFFIFYLCFTVFEIRTLLAKLRQNFDRDGKSDEAKQKNEL
jgi:FlaA1/EpsC-like NDP-sugar epimerase